MHCPTKRALDAGDSAAFSSIFLARTESCFWSFIYARPTATNANRSADFSHWLVTKRALGGAMWDDCASRDARIWYGDQVVSIPEEADLFTFLQLDYLEPAARTEGRWHTLPAGGLPL